jgi:hypothetical protein
MRKGLSGKKKTFKMRPNAAYSYSDIRLISGDGHGRKRKRYANTK